MQQLFKFDHQKQCCSPYFLNQLLHHLSVATIDDAAFDQDKHTADRNYPDKVQITDTNELQFLWLVYIRLVVITH